MFAPYNGYIIFPTVAVFLYDWVLTLDDEIQLIWLRKWSTTTALFCILRYGTLALKSIDLWTSTTSGISDGVRISTLSLNAADITRSCSATQAAGSGGIVIIVIVMQVVLQMRIYIMYNRSRRLLILNTALFVLEAAATAYLLIRLRTERLTSSLDVIGSCYALVHNATGYGWIPPLIYELYLASLAVAKIVRDRRLVQNLDADSILGVLVRGSIAYFLLVAFAMVGAIGIFFSSRLLAATTNSLIDCASAIGGVRLILATRDAVQPEPSAREPSATATATQLGFGRFTHNEDGLESSGGWDMELSPVTSPGPRAS